MRGHFYIQAAEVVIGITLILKHIQSRACQMTRPQCIAQSLCINYRTA
jgi:hypothetical protein